MSTVKKAEVWIVSHDNDNSRFKSYSAAKLFAKSLVQGGRLVERVHPEQRMIELVGSVERPMVSVRI
jgi:hypothetical protein